MEATDLLKRSRIKHLNNKKEWNVKERRVFKENKNDWRERKKTEG